MFAQATINSLKRSRATLNLWLRFDRLDLWGNIFARRYMRVCKRVAGRVHLILFTSSSPNQPKCIHTGQKSVSQVQNSAICLLSHIPLATTTTIITATTTPIVVAAAEDSRAHQKYCSSVYDVESVYQ